MKRPPRTRPANHWPEDEPTLQAPRDPATAPGPRPLPKKLRPHVKRARLGEPHPTIEDWPDAEPTMYSGRNKHRPSPPEPPRAPERPARRQPRKSEPVSSDSQTVPVRPRDLHIGRYKVAKVLGKGGMGAVYLATDPDAGHRHVAVKVIKGKADPDATARFLLEGRVTATLEHPNIIPVYDVGYDPSHGHYYVMRLLPGRDLTAFLREPRTLREKLEVMLKVLDGMAYAHEQGIIHRDLKPDNVFIGPHGQVAVADWGIAKVLQDEDPHARQLEESILSLDDLDQPELTQEGSVMGTPAYMAPEQARGEVSKLDPRTDVYALGAILYHALTGLKPIAAPGVRPLLKKIREGRVTPPRTRLAHERRNDPDLPHPDTVPVELDAIVMKAMAKHPAQRYQSADEMKDDLVAFLEHRPLSAHRDGLLSSAKKYVQRKPAKALGVAGGALFSLAVTAIGAFAYAGIEAAEAEKARAEQQAQVEAAEKEQALANARAKAAEAEQARTRALFQEGKIEELEQDLGISIKYERDRALDEMRELIEQGIAEGRTGSFLQDLPNEQVERYFVAFREALDAEERLGRELTDHLDWAVLGRVYHTVLQQPLRAIPAYEESFRRNPQYLKALGQISAAYLNAEMWEEAEQAAHRVLRHNPTGRDRAMTLMALSAALQYQGQYNNAIERGQQALALLDRDDAYAEVIRSRIDWMRAQQR